MFMLSLTTSMALEDADMKVRNERLTVKRDDGFVLFLIGARVNKWWVLPVVWGVAAAMTRMMRDLESDPSLGLLSSEGYFGRTTLMIQYWRSFEDLHRYAHAREQKHLPAWRRWLKKWAEGAVGIFHEAYVVEPGTYESLYHHMPPFGLGKVGPLVSAEGTLASAKGRLGGEERRAA
jgi:hypothetical protein